MLTHVYDGPPNYEDHCVLANEKAKCVVERINNEKDFPLPELCRGRWAI